MFYGLKTRTAKSSFRETFLSTSLIFGVFIVAMTEILSLFKLITFSAYLVTWLGLLAISLLVFFKYRAKKQTKDAEDKNAFGTLFIIVLSFVAIYLVIIALIGIIAPPNTWDSLEYHMPKVAHWMQNQSVAFYPTDNPRQNHQSPGAEFLILQLQVLSGGDRFANLVSFYCMIGSIVGASLVAKKLGAGMWGQLFSAVFIITLPMGIMQASSTQTDYVAAFYMICLVYFVLKIIDPEEQRLLNYALLSFAVGLGVLTKASTYIYAIPFLIWMLVVLFRSQQIRAIKPLVMMGLMILILNSGQYIRNYNLHGNPLGPGREPMANTKYTNDMYTPKTLISNSVRNTAIHMNIPWEGPRNRLDTAIVRFHHKLGISENDPRTTWGSFARFSVRDISYNDEFDGNPLHLLLILICIILAFSIRKLRDSPHLIYYTISICTAFLLFSFILKWNPWHSRLHMTQFVLAGPFCALVLSKLFNRKIIGLISLLFLFLHLPWLLKCNQRPLVGEHNIFDSSRFELYFNHEPRRNHMDRYRNSWDYIKSNDYKNVGMITNPFSWEYVFWAMKYADRSDVRFENVAVRNISNTIIPKDGKPDFIPEAVLSLVNRRTDTLIIADNYYVKSWSERNFSIYTQEP